MDSPPRRSPGKYELRELGVARCWSLLSSPELLQSELLEGGAPQSWLAPAPQVSLGGGPVLVAVGRRPPQLLAAPEDCWAEPGFVAPAPPLPWDSCCRRVWTSLSTGDSAKMVVLPRTQLLRAPWACGCARAPRGQCVRA